MDDQAYLEPGFDASGLTVPRLRSILLAHNVNYPASSKKPQLVDLFNEHVASQARKIKSDSLRVKRSSRGIVNAPSAASSVRDEDEEDEAPATATRSSRRSTRARTEEAEEVKPTPRAVRHSTAPPEGVPTPRRASSKRAPEKVEEEDEEPEAKRPASRKSRVSAVTPSVRRERDDTSPFSADNVFQSGGSPPATESRRRTYGTSDEAKRRRSRDARRRTEEVRPSRPQTDGAVVPRRSTFEVPAPRRKRDEVEPDEEFTPEGQMELVQAEQAGEVVPARRRQPRPASSAANTGIMAVVSAFVLGFGYLWSDEKFNVGYCGVGSPSDKIANTEIPEWANIMRPECEPCPPHAMCNDRLETFCEPGFVVTQHPMSLGGLLPIPPTCEPDSVRARKVEAVKERAVEELREQNALYECGEAASPEIQEGALKSAVSSQKRKSMSQEEFDDLWGDVEGELLKADEITAGAGGTLRSNSLARIPLACAIRRSLVETLRRYVWPLVMLLSILSGTGYARHRITSGRADEERAKQLASLALQKLSLQASLHASEPDVWAEDYVSVAQLRDDVLRDEFSATRRKKLWTKVQQKVEHNSNVRPIVRESRSGDVGRTWQWVGAVGRLESPDNSGYENRRKSGRVSFGGERWLEPEGERSTSEMSKVTRWKEGGQYY